MSALMLARRNVGIITKGIVSFGQVGLATYVVNCQLNLSVLGAICSFQGSVFSPDYLVTT